MKRIFVFGIICILLCGCATAKPKVIMPHRITDFALDSVVARSIRSVAIFPVFDPEDLEGVSERMAQIISLQVLKIGRFKIIESTAVKSLIDKQKKALTGEMTVEDILIVAEKMGVDAIIYGQLIAYRTPQFFPERNF